ncbi:MAG: DNA-binding response regulator [Desulfuromonas sp.]|nr:MAG: DNA-binding response regulator [Desulfuromonas sp.]
MPDKIPLLLVEDEPHIAQGLIFNLEAEGYRVNHVETGETALQALERDRYALLILDLMLPGIDGLEVCRTLREQGNQIPVLMLTARGADQDRIAGLSTGADDYLPKPFNLQEFLLRIAALLRRSNWKEEKGTALLYRFGANSIDLENHEAETPQGTIQLTGLEIKMLRLFFANENKILTRADLLRQVWDMSPKTETRTLDNFIVRLRKYFEADPSRPKHFRTVRGRGYRFVREP